MHCQIVSQGFQQGSCLSHVLFNLCVVVILGRFLSTNSTILANFDEERHSDIKLIPILQVLWDKSHLSTVKLISTKSVGCENGG